MNGRYLPQRDAAVHVEDRGYQFADGVYEVCEVRGGRLIDQRRHMERLQRSLVRIADRDADVACSARRRLARGGPSQRRARRDRLPSDHARRCEARPCFSAGRHAPGHRGHGQPHRSGQDRAPCRGRDRRRDGAGQSMGPRRHQVDRAAAECAGEADRARAGRPRGLVRGCGRDGHRGLVVECLDRDAPATRS